MDLASTFKLKIWSSSPNSRKDSSYAIIKYIDKDTTNYEDFVDEFTEEHRMGLNESLKLSYFRRDLHKYVDVTNDQDMMGMFSTFDSSKYIELIVFICPLNATQSVTSNTENAPNESNVHDQSCNQSNTSSQQASLIPILCDTSYLAKLFPMYEHIGVDEEGMHGVEVVDVTIPTNCVVVEKGVSVQGSGGEEESSEGEESGEGEESSEEEERGEGEESSEGEGRVEGEEGSENRVTSNAREDFMHLLV
jgi:hypothetical protein